MTITSKYRKRLWVEIEVEEYGSVVATSADSVDEAKEMIEQLKSVIQDLEQYIEDKTPKTQ